MAVAPEQFEKWGDHQGLGARSNGFGPTQGPESGKVAEKCWCKLGLFFKVGGVWPRRPPPRVPAPLPLNWCLSVGKSWS